MKVKITYEWEFQPSDWIDYMTHIEEVKNNVRIKLNFDHVGVFYHLTDVSYPELLKVEIEKE